MHAARGGGHGVGLYSVVLTFLVFACFPPLFLGTGNSGEILGEENITSILDSLTLRYDKRIRPNYGGSPVEVGVTMYILSISSLSEVKMDFTLDFYFRQFWIDPRLAFNDRTKLETLSVGSEFTNNIWVPDTFFANEKKSYFHVATSSNEFIRIHNTGFVTRSLRLTITAECPMELQYFPMDRQLCRIEIESFGYTMRDIRYKWNEGPNSVGIAQEVSLPQFKVIGHRQRSKEISLSTGNYSRLICEIQFGRSMGYYLIQIYIPSGLIVVISWVSFWLNRNATPARVSLGVTTVLTMTTLMSSTNSALPKISYVKSIDVYLGTCFSMVFASLLEYAAVGYMAKRIALRKQQYMAKLKENKRAAAAAEALALTTPQLPVDVAGPSTAQPDNFSRNRTQTHSQRGNGSRSADYRPRVPRHGVLETAFNGSPAVTVPAPTPLQPRPDEEVALPVIPKDLKKIFGITPSDVDKYSRLIFPIGFISFNITYWVIYLNVSDVIADDLVPFNGNT